MGEEEEKETGPLPDRGYLPSGRRVQMRGGWSFQAGGGTKPVLTLVRDARARIEAGMCIGKSG